MWWADIEVPNLLVDVNSWRRSACSNCYPPFFVKKAEIFVKKSLWFTPKFRLCQRLKAKQFPPSLSVLLEDTPQILQCDSTLSKHRFFLPGLLRRGKALTQAKKCQRRRAEAKPRHFFALQKSEAAQAKKSEAALSEQSTLFFHSFNQRFWCFFVFGCFLFQKKKKKSIAISICFYI